MHVIDLRVFKLTERNLFPMWLQITVLFSSRWGRGEKIISLRVIGENSASPNCECNWMSNILTRVTSYQIYTITQVKSILVNSSVIQPVLEPDRA